MPRSKSACANRPARIELPVITGTIAAPIDPDSLQLRSAWRDAALPFAAALAIEKKLASAASLLPISGNAPDGWRRRSSSAASMSLRSSIRRCPSEPLAYAFS